MAKIKIPKVVRSLDLKEYYETGESQIIRVWINPPRSLRNQLNDTQKRSTEIIAELKQMSDIDEDESDETKAKLKELGAELKQVADDYLGFWSVVWSQDKDESTHWTPEDVAQLQKDCNEQDPGLWQFITTMTVGIMNDYMIANSKKERRR